MLDKEEKRIESKQKYVQFANFDESSTEEEILMDDYQIHMLQRVVVSIVILQWMAWFSFLLFIFKFTFIYTALNRYLSFSLTLIAVLCIFVDRWHANKAVDKVDEYIWRAVILKILKSIGTIMIFSVNGNQNDLYVTYFFFCTSLAGVVYLSFAGYDKEPFPVLNPSDNQSRLDVIKVRIHHEEIIRRETRAFWMLVFMTIFMFLISLMMACQSIDYYSGEMSSMGIVSCILILANLAAWPSMLENIRNRTRVMKYHDDKIKTKEFLSHLDKISEFCSCLMQQLQPIHGKEVKSWTNREEKFERILRLLPTKESERRKIQKIGNELMGKKVRIFADLSHSNPLKDSHHHHDHDHDSVPADKPTERKQSQTKRSSTFGRQSFSMTKQFTLAQKENVVYRPLK